jgi:hypothetical protein
MRDESLPPFCLVTGERVYSLLEFRLCSIPVPHIGAENSTGSANDWQTISVRQVRQSRWTP